MLDDASTPVAPTAVRVWDLPTRVVHWLLVACVTGLVITGHVGGNALVWHMRFGLAVGALLVFRVLWGLVGGRWSRFASFVYSPASVWRYLRGRPRVGDHFDVGHNPLGSFSVLGLLGLMALQVGTGLFVDDEISTTGPLNRFVSSASASIATHWHKTFGQVLILSLVGLHIAAIAWYFWHEKRNLVRPMWSGDKPLPPGTPASLDNAVTRVVAALLLGACAALAVWVSQFG